MSQKTSITPMMEQYLRLKEEHKDKLLLYRLGDFYELFFEDAKIAALEMDIVLTTRGKHLDKDIPMCGVPHLKLDHYLAKLIKSGHIVAICEQVESAEDAKKRGSKSIVKREVTRIITPGTLIEEGYLESSRNNFLFTFVEKNSNGTAAWLDFSTGSIFIKDTISQRLIELIYEVKPSEIVLDNTSFYDLLNKRSDMPIVTISENGEPLYKKKLEDLIPSFDKSSYSDDELLAIEILINYCQETNKTKEMSFSAPIRISQSEFVEMDISTKNNLEIFINTRGGKKDTLFNTINKTVTSFGARLLNQFLNYPLINILSINKRLDKVEALFNNFSALEKLRGSLKGIPDLERALTRLQLKKGSPIDLNYIKVGLLRSKDIDGIIVDHQLSSIFNDSPIKKLDAILERLNSHLADQVNPNIRDGNFIKIGCSEELDKIRYVQESSKNLLAKMQKKLIQKTGINSLKIKYNNNLGYFIETPSSYSEKILNETYSQLFFHRQSTANSIRVTTNELLELESQIMNANELCLNLEIKIFEELLLATLSSSEKLKKLFEFLAELDVFCANAYLARTNDWVRPKIVDRPDFIIKGGRHPVVEASLEASGIRDFVPNDCDISIETSFINLVTGPNMAGKSTFFRQNALIGILSHIGFFVPAKDAIIGNISKIFCRMGASDNLAKGESTFMVEMRETATILKNADCKTLVILDEVGRGTSTYDGMSIAWACLEYLYKTNKCRTIFATHYHELTKMADIFSGIKNLSVSAKEWQGKLIFLHKVHEGKAIGSYGVKIAEIAGLPKEVIENSSKILRSLDENQKVININDNKDKKNIEQTAHPKNVDQLKDTIKNLNLDSMSPIEALELLYKLKEPLDDN